MAKHHVGHGQLILDAFPCLRNLHNPPGHSAPCGHGTYGTHQREVDRTWGGCGSCARGVLLHLSHFVRLIVLCQRSLVPIAFLRMAKTEQDAGTRRVLGRTRCVTRQLCKMHYECQVMQFPRLVRRGVTARCVTLNGHER